MTQTEQFTVAQLNNKVAELTAQLDEQKETIEVVNRGITTLILAVKGNDEYKQAGMVQNLAALTIKVEAMHTDVEELKQTKLRAVKIGAWLLGGISTLGGWAWANLDKINSFFHAPAR